MSHSLRVNTIPRYTMLGGLFLGMSVVGLLAFGRHGESSEKKPDVAAEVQGSEIKKLPEELDALNLASRKMYADARRMELSMIPIVIVVSGDDLILRRNGKRTVETVIPPEYHALKCVSHSTLALFTHLSSERGKPLGDERLKSLKEYEALLTATVPAIEKTGFNPDVLARQKRILSRALQFTTKVLQDGKVSSDDLEKFCRTSRADILANGADAAKAQLLATHKQMMTWKKDMTAEEWSALTVIVCGSQTPRIENAAVQYFSRLFGETNGEGRRVVYAESLWDEEKAVNLLGTLRLDGRLSVAVFGDPFRMYRDFLADGARSAIDDILAAP
jgi:hypothetical protein